MKRLTKRHLTSWAILPRLFEQFEELCLLGYKRERAAVHHIMKKAPVVCSIALILLIEATSSSHHANIANVHHHVGDTARLTCPTGGSVVRWRRVGGLLPEGAWSDKTGNLHLPGQVEDSGVYECFTCSGNESISAQTEVTFFSNDAPNQKPIPIFVENGSSMTLNCWRKGASHLYSRVFWFKGDSKPLPSHARVEEDGSLTLTNIRHGAVYHCVIPVRYISCVPTHNTFHIQIIGPPTLVARPESQTVGLGGEAVFSCQFHGHPTPEVRWTKEDSGNSSRALRHVGSVLKIASVTSESAGLYSCTGSNEGGRLSASARLTVLPNPDPPRVVHHVAYSNGSVLLHWRQPRHGPPVSSYSVSYSECCASPEWTTVDVAAGDHKRTLQCVLTGLKPGWDYTVSVVAHSSNGRRSAPLAFNFSTPAEEEPGSQLNATESVSDLINDALQFRPNQHNSFPAILSVLVPIASFAACFFLLLAAVGCTVVVVRRQRRCGSYDLTSQKQTYQELPNVFVHEMPKRVPPRWRKFIERKSEESLVAGSDINLSFRSGDKEDTRPDTISEEELSASEGDALLKEHT